MHSCALWLLFSRYDSRVKAMELDERPTEQYSDIGGLDKQIEEVQHQPTCTVKPLITDPPKSGQPLYNGRCQVNICIPKNTHPRCTYSREYRHPDAYIYVNTGTRVPTFTVNMGIPL